MSGVEIFFIVAQVLGGLALFIYGMRVMSQGLQRAGGSRLREILFHLTRNRVAGVGIGTLLGFLVHSSAATVMLVGFVNAGLVSLVQSIAVIAGANVGTTFSMQLISFKLDEYAFAGIALGMLLQVLPGRRDLVRHLGAILFGFGLLFLGMKTMSSGVAPLRGSEWLQSLLAHTGSDSVGAALLGLLLSTAVTGIIQSSGAMVGILFALSSAGVFTDLSQVLPLLLGAHIGTCVTGLLGSIGTNIEARRTALAHLVFNILGSVLALAMLRFYLWLVPLTADDLTRQIANAHTAVQLINALVLLPLVGPFAKLLTLITPSKAPMPERSHLEVRHLETPETAIVAALREARRMTDLARSELRDAMRGILAQDRRPFLSMERTEAAVNEIKASIESFLFQLSARRLSRRQSILVQHVLSAVTDIERIGDHATVLRELTEEKLERRVWFEDEAMQELIDLYRRVARLLRLTAESLEPLLSDDERADLARAILDARDDIKDASVRMKERHRQRVQAREEDPLTGLFFARYVACFDKIVRHSRSIARTELKPMFFVKPHKLERTSPVVPREHAPEEEPLPFDESIFDE